MEKAYFNWNSGKHSAMALYYAIKYGKHEVLSLFTIDKNAGTKIAMHEIGIDLYKRQAGAIGIPLTVLEYDYRASEEEYKRTAF